MWQQNDMFYSHKEPLISLCSDEYSFFANKVSSGLWVALLVYKALYELPLQFIVYLLSYKPEKQIVHKIE